MPLHCLDQAMGCASRGVSRPDCELPVKGDERHFEARWVRRHEENLTLLISLPCGIQAVSYIPRLSEAGAPIRTALAYLLLI